LGLIAIDGRGGSGKSTLAERVRTCFNGASVVHVDDFYRPEAHPSHEIGGSFDLERLRGEVLEPLRAGRRATFRPLDWERATLSARSIRVEPRGLVVVEGVYTLHPILGECWDLTAFLDVPLDVCRERLAARGENAPDELARWEAEEGRYLEELRPMERADLVLRPRED
jgi:uridine kinase